MYPKSGFQVIVLGGLLLGAVAALGDEWPQWLGPNRDSVWRETGIVETFPTNGPPIRWRASVGQGYSGPAVVRDRVFVTDRHLAEGVASPADPFARSELRGVERVLCLNEADGSLVWKHEYDCPYTISYPAGPRATPLVNGDQVFTLGAEGNLLCLSVKDGKVLWSRDFRKDFGIPAPLWGFACNPLLDGNRLICLVGGKGSVAVAFDKNTGKELWRALTAEEPGYSSPAIFEAGGKRQLIIWDPESANGLDPETGKVYWSVPFKCGSGMSIATPRKLNDELFFTTFYNGSLMLRLDGGQPLATAIWQTQKTNEKDTTHLNAVMCTPFLEDGYIYGVCSYGQLRCLKADSGERIWETLQATTTDGKPVRWGNAFIVKQANRFFIFNEKGDLLIAKLSPKGYEELSRTHLLDPVNQLPGRGVVWSHPAFAHRCVYARNDKEILCADLAQRTR
jgi:outer membrane protein assembly factor BamB